MGANSVVLVVLWVALMQLEMESVVGAGAGEVKGSYPPSTICATQAECVSYQVIHTQKEFEIRTYPVSTWIASANITTISYNLGRNAGFQQAYGYYRGNNKEKFQWDDKRRTQPVLTDVIPNTSFDSIYRVYIHVPNDYQNKTLPEPLDSEPVTLIKFPPKKLAAVQRFEGQVNDKSVAAEVEVLKKSLKGTPWEAAAAQTGSTLADYVTITELILWFDQK